MTQHLKIELYTSWLFGMIYKHTNTFVYIVYWLMSLIEGVFLFYFSNMKMNFIISIHIWDLFPQNERQVAKFHLKVISRFMMFRFSGVSWGVHSVRLHPGGLRGAPKRRGEKERSKERERKKGKKRGAKEGEKGRERKYAKEKEKWEEIKRKKGYKKKNTRVATREWQ